MIESVRKVLKILRGRQQQAYLVGGAVRDVVVGRDPKDFDVATDMKPWAVMALFRETNRFKAIPTGIAHGTVTVITPEGDSVEVTTFRKDVATDGRRATVEWADKIEDDLGRRDFTMNAIAYSPEGELVDPFGGVDDIKAGIIRTVGDPETRFREDGLRILRAIRFHAQLGFQIEDRTLYAIGGSLETLKKVSWERKRDELLKILAASPGGIEAALTLISTRNIIPHLLPGMVPSYLCTQNVFHADDVWTHSVLAAKAMRAKTDDVELVLAALLHDIGKPESKRATKTCFVCHSRKITDDKCEKCGREEVVDDCSFHAHDVIGERLARAELRQLKFSNRTIDRICNLIRYHLFRIDSKTVEKKCEPCQRRWKFYSSRLVEQTRGWETCPVCKRPPTSERQITNESSLGSIRRIMRNVGGKEPFMDLLLLREADRQGNRNKKGTTFHHELARLMVAAIDEEDSALKLRDLAINGHDLHQMGVQTGPAFSYILCGLLDRVIEDPALNEEGILRKIAMEELYAEYNSTRAPRRTE